MKKLFFLLVALFSFCQMAAAQFQNGDFSLPGNGGSCSSITGWTFSGAEYTNYSYNHLGTNYWIDLTPCLSFGNGASIEQKVYLSACKNYSVSLSLGSFNAWNQQDAGVTLFLNNVAVGSRIFNNTFSNTADPLLWQSKTSAPFTVPTSGIYTIKLVGASVLIKDRGYTGTEVGVGVIGVDNVVLNSSDIPTTTTITGNLSICAGASTTLTAASGSSYKWSSNVPAAQATLQTVTVSAAGAYSVTVTNASGCTATASATVVVNPLPIATTSAKSICAGETIVLTAIGGGTYKWTGPNNFTSTLQNPTIPNATTAMSGVYTVTVTNATGCTTSITNTTVTVNALPVATITGTTSICAGLSTTLKATGSGTYKWSSNVPAAQATLQTVTVSAAGTYSVTVTNAAGCSATASTIVTVNPLPVVTITGNTPACGAIKTVLTATGGGTYKWNVPVALPSTSPTLPVGSSGTYSVTVTSAAGCVATKSVTVSFSSAPVINLIAQKITCEGSSSNVSIDINVSGGTVPYTYKWSNNTVAQNLSNAGGGFVSNVSSYCVTVTDAKGCTATRCFDCVSPCSTNTGILIDLPVPFMAPTTTAVKTTPEEKSNVESSPVEEAQTNVSKKAETKVEAPSTVKKSAAITKSTGVKILGFVVGGSLVNFIIQKLNTHKSLPKLR